MQVTAPVANLATRIDDNEAKPSWFKRVCRKIANFFGFGKESRDPNSHSEVAVALARPEFQSIDFFADKVLNSDLEEAQDLQAAIDESKEIETKLRDDENLENLVASTPLGTKMGTFWPQLELENFVKRTINFGKDLESSVNLVHEALINSVKRVIALFDGIYKLFHRGQDQELMSYLNGDSARSIPAHFNTEDQFRFQGSTPSRAVKLYTNEANIAAYKSSRPVDEVVTRSPIAGRYEMQGYGRGAVIDLQKDTMTATPSPTGDHVGGWQVNSEFDIIKLHSGSNKMPLTTEYGLRDDGHWHSKLFIMPDDISSEMVKPGQEPPPVFEKILSGADKYADELKSDVVRTYMSKASVVYN